MSACGVGFGKRSLIRQQTRPTERQGGQQAVDSYMELIAGAGSGENCYTMNFYLNFYTLVLIESNKSNKALAKQYKASDWSNK